jgi:hypothetical protein
MEIKSEKDSCHLITWILNSDDTWLAPVWVAGCSCGVMIISEEYSDYFRRIVDGSVSSFSLVMLSNI